jgi:hypothetical protein
MIQPVTLIGVGLCFLLLFLKYRSQPKDRPRSSPKQRIKTAKMLLAAFVAWMALSFTLQHMIVKIDGPDTHEPSLLERIVFFLK